MVDLTKSVKYVKGVGPAKAEVLAKLRYFYAKGFDRVLSKRL